MSHSPTPRHFSRRALNSSVLTHGLSIWSAIRYTLIALTTIALIHLSFVWLAPEHSYTATVRTAIWDSPRVSDGSPHSPDHAVHHQTPTKGHQAQGAFFRDPFPLRTLVSFWDLAEREVAAKSLDTCESQLGRQFIDSYHETELPYCVPHGLPSGQNAAAARNTSGSWKQGDGALPPTYITCSAIHRHPFTRWWPYPAAPCLSSNLRMIQGEAKASRAAGCEVTDEGNKLVVEMGKEDFMGPHAVNIDLDSDEAVCREVIDHTTLLIGRQDQWNP